MNDPSTEYLLGYIQNSYNDEQIKALGGYKEGALAHHLGYLDYAFFCKYYLPHYFKLPYSPMHVNLMEEIQKLRDTREGMKIANASPRGSAKSTIAVTGQILWNICYGFTKYILLIKDTYDQAGLDVSGVKEELDNNPLIHRDFGILKGRKWGSNELNTNTGILLQALGSGMKIRGRRYREHRPGLVILDDIENDENTNTPDQRMKLERWVNRAVMKVGDTKTHYFLIGTILHYDSLLSRILINPGWISKKYQAVINWAEDQTTWDKWNEVYTDIDNLNRITDAESFFQENKQKMLEGSEVLWPEGQDYYFLMRKRIDEGIPSFDSEFQNEPITLEDALFHKFFFYHLKEKQGEEGTELWIEPMEKGMPVKLTECTLFGSCDPSMGRTKTSDYSAIMVAALSPNKRLFILDADIKRRHPTQIIQDIFNYVRRYKDLGLPFQQFAVESVSFQEFFKDQVAEESMKEGLYLPLVETRAANRNKEVRIESLEPDVTNGYIMFSRDQRLLLDQLRYFPKADHDDGPDALEMVRDLSRGGMIIDSVEF